MQKELEELQDSLAMNDLLIKPGIPKLTEILLKKMEPIQFRMEQDRNHAKPQLHISYGKQTHVTSYGITDGQMLAGNIPYRYDRDVTKGISNNQSSLLQIWNNKQSGNQQNYEILIGQL
jgi:hypothetical protein